VGTEERRVRAFSEDRHARSRAQVMGEASPNQAPSDAAAVRAQEGALSRRLNTEFVREVAGVAPEATTISVPRDPGSSRRLNTLTRTRETPMRGSHTPGRQLILRLGIRECRLGTASSTPTYR